jgi:polyisoprenoid-binding protein YceI
VPFAKTLFVAIALVACAAGPAGYASAADRYQIDPDHTFSSFEYHHWHLSIQRGRFDRTSGSIELDVPNKTGAIEIAIDATSVNTGSSLFDSALRSESFFDASQYPQILFKSNALHFTDDKLTQVDGDLTIKGVTRPATFDITYFNCRFMFIYFKQACGANGTTKILRSDFNMGRYVPFVGDDVTLYFSIEGIKE